MAILRMRNRGVDSYMAHGPSSVYATWPEPIKDYIVARPLDPGHQRKSQLDSIISFTRSVWPVKERIEFIKHHDQHTTFGNQSGI